MRLPLPSTRTGRFSSWHRTSGHRQFDRPVVVALTAAAALGAAAASAAPTGSRPADVMLRAIAAATVTVAASKARRWTGLALAAAACAVAHGLLLVPAVAAMLVSLLVTKRRARPRVAGAAIAALAIQVLFRQHPIGFHGASTLIGLAATLPVLRSADRLCRTRIRRRNHRILGAAFSVFLVATACFGVAVLLARHDLEVGAARAQSALAAARAGDTRVAQQHLDESAEALRHGASLTGAWWAAPALAVPLIGKQAKAISVVVGEGRNVVRSAKTAASVGDYRKLRYRTGRFDIAALRRLQRPLADAATVLVQARDRLAFLDRGWLLGPVRTRLDDFAQEIDRATPEAALASSVINSAPGLLGGDGTRRYFIAFITPAELRGAGGFIGNYGELTVRSGRVRLTRSGPIRELIDAAPAGKRRLRGPSDYIRRYGRFRPADYFQDVMFSPHFPFDADVIEQLYPQSGGDELDGVLSIDPFALGALLRLTGPITVPGLGGPLTSANAADILLRRQYVRFGDDPRRKDLLVEASRITFDKLTTGSLPAPAALADALGPMVTQRRIMLHATRTVEQRLFGRLKADGALPPANGGDVVSVATSNRGNNKIDSFLHRDLSYRATLDPSTGGVTASLTVKFRNDAPPSGLPRVMIGNNFQSPPGTNLTTVSLYSPLGLELTTLDGSPIGVETGREAGLNVYSFDLAIPPRETQSVTFRLAGGLDMHRGYHLVALPQPTANPDRMTVDLDVKPGWRVVPHSGMHLSGRLATLVLPRLNAAHRYTVGFRR